MPRPRSLADSFRLAAVLPVLLLLGLAWPDPAEAQHRDGDGNITMAMVGDLIITRALSVYEEPEFLKLRDLIHGATVALGNMEMLLHDFEPDVIPAAQSGGTYMAAHPDMAKELAWMGFDMLSLANNHTMDYMEGGLRATMRALDAAGIKHAGGGENLALARAPAYLETSGGRVALISVASTFAAHMRAGHQRPDMRGRPGLSPIRFQTTRIVPRDVYETLQEVRSEVGGVDGSFQAGDGWRVVTTPHEGDLEEVLAVIRDARRQANWVVVTSHSHEGDGDRYVPAQALVTFARLAVEAGADAFYGHGPHVLRGIEIHQGKPIFYSLGDFIFQNETPAFQPWDNYANQGLGFEAFPADFYDARIAASPVGSWPGEAFWWDSAMALTEFRDGEPYQIRLVPVVLGFGLHRAQRGRPVAASGEDAQRILELLQELSEPFGTRIDIVDGEGIIRLGTARTDGSR
jgi:hypothetical protein